jgi:hypothetical protein
MIEQRQRARTNTMYSKKQFFHANWIDRSILQFLNQSCLIHVFRSNERIQRTTVEIWEKHSMASADNSSKKVKIDESQSAHHNEQKSLFYPYQALGYVTRDLPCFIQTRGQNFVFLCSIGRSFHIYDWSRINLLFVGPSFDKHITALTAKNDNQYVALGDTIVFCRRAKEVLGISTGAESDILPSLYSTFEFLSSPKQASFR